MPNAAVRNLLLRPHVSPILPFLAAYWPMEAASGATEPDSIGSSNLTSNNTVGSGAGVSSGGLARTFVAASSQSLSIADNAAISLGSNLTFWLGGWALATATGSAMYLLHKGTTGFTAATAEYRLLLNAGATITFSVSDGTTTASAISAALTAGAWCRVDAIYDGKTISIRLNNGLPVRTAWTNGVWDSTNTLRFGAVANASANFFGGSLDEWFLAKGLVPSAAQLAWVFNNGKGRSFAEIQRYTSYQITLWDVLDKAKRLLGLRAPAWATAQLPRIPRRFRGRGGQAWTPALGAC